MHALSTQGTPAGLTLPIIVLTATHTTFRSRIVRKVRHLLSNLASMAEEIFFELLRFLDLSILRLAVPDQLLIKSSGLLPIISLILARPHRPHLLLAIVAFPTSRRSCGSDALIRSTVTFVSII